MLPKLDRVGWDSYTYIQGSYGSLGESFGYVGRHIRIGEVNF